MQKVQPIEYGNYYHIFNRGINGTNLFLSKENYLYFMDLYKKHIPKTADTFAYCLLKNHFHVLVRIKDEDEIEYMQRKTPTVVTNPVGGLKGNTLTELVNPIGGLLSKKNKALTGYKTTVRLPRKKYNPSSQFSHLFNAYAQAFNKQNKRTGSLFERPFERRLIDTEKYFIELVSYIHNNPVHHGFVDTINNYPWSSYRAYYSEKPTSLKKEMVIDWFGGIKNFKYVHKTKQEYTKIEKYIIE